LCGGFVAGGGQKENALLRAGLNDRLEQAVGLIGTEAEADDVRAAFDRSLDTAGDIKSGSVVVLAVDIDRQNLD